MKNGFLKVFLAEWKILLTSPKRFFYVLIFPLLLFGFLSAIFIEGVPRNLPVAYLDNDQSTMSTKLIRTLDSSPSIRMALPVVSSQEAEVLIQQGKVYGFIVIPKDFQKRIYKSLHNEVVCYTNNQYLLPAGLIQKEFQQVIGTFSAGVSYNKAIQSGTQVDKALADQVPVKTDIHILFNPYTNYAYYLLTVILPMVLQMIAMMVTVYIIGFSFKYKTTIQWLADSNGNAWVALWAKLLPYTICLGFLSWWMNYLLFERIGVPLKTGMFNVTLITFLMVFIYQLLGVVFVAISKDLRSAMTIGSGFTAIAMSFAAYTFPIEGLPKSMQYLSLIFPFRHFVDYFVNRAIRGISIESTIIPLYSLIGFCVIFIIAYPLFVKKMKKGGYD